MLQSPLRLPSLTRKRGWLKMIKTNLIPVFLWALQWEWGGVRQ